VFWFVSNFNKHDTECEVVSGNLFSNSQEGLYSKMLVSFGTMVSLQDSSPSVICTVLEEGVVWMTQKSRPLRGSL